MNGSLHGRLARQWPTWREDFPGRTDVEVGQMLGILPRDKREWEQDDGPAELDFSNYDRDMAYAAEYIREFDAEYGGGRDRAEADYEGYDYDTDEETR